MDNVQRNVKKKLFPLENINLNQHVIVNYPEYLLDIKK